MMSAVDQHGCGITWCRQGSDPLEPHWCTVEYAPATMGTVPIAMEAPPDGGGVSFPTVGTGVRWDETVGVPAVFIHIFGCGIDVDAYMRPDEAELLLGALQDALGIARETIAGSHRAAPRPN